MLEIGQTVWFFDQNHRVYEKGGHGGPIWRKHWVPKKVIGETSRSFIVGPNNTKLDKRKVASGACRGWAFSEEEIDKAAFVEKAWAVADSVRSIRDYDTLVEIARLSGYPIPNPPALERP